MPTVLSEYEAIFVPKSLYGKIDWHTRNAYYKWRRTQTGRVIELLDALKYYQANAAKWMIRSNWPD